MPDLAEIHYAHARRIETLVSQAPQIEKALTADAKAALRGHGPICERFIERALCEYAKYWDYALGLKASLWPNRQPLGPKSLGVFLLRDGSLKCKASRAKLSKAKCWRAGRACFQKGQSCSETTCCRWRPTIRVHRRLGHKKVSERHQCH